MEYSSKNLLNEIKNKTVHNIVIDLAYIHTFYVGRRDRHLHTYWTQVGKNWPTTRLLQDWRAPTEESMAHTLLFIKEI